jgi:membrane-bound lytic murein transglycosylase
MSILRSPISKPFAAFGQVDDTLPTDIHNAIEAFDYRLAQRISDNSRRVHSGILQSGSLHFQEQLTEEVQSYHEDLVQANHSIERELENQLSRVKQDYQTKFTELVDRHRREAEDLRARWISHHEQAESVARKKVNDMMHTSKVLALLESYESAEGLRVRTETEQLEIIAQEVRQGDEHFRKQFTGMIQRHAQQYDGLFGEMTRLMNIAKGKANLQKTAMKSKSQEKLSLSPVRMIREIEASEFSPVS